MTELGEDTSNSTLVTQFEGWVQRVYDEVGTVTRWRWLKTIETINTVASTEEYSLSVDVYAIRSMRIDPTDEPITYRQRESLVNGGYDLDVTGKPVHWYFSGWDAATDKNTIKLWPIPDAVYNIEVEEDQNVTSLATGDNIPAPRDVISVIELGTLAMALFHEKDFDGYDRMYPVFRDNLNKLRIRYAHPNADRRLAVSDIPRASGFELRRPDVITP